MADLVFEPVGHVYRYGGRVVPSVTQVLEPLQMLGGVSWDVLEAARDFGTNVHAACHLWNIGELDEETLDPALKPYLVDWREFLSETGFVVRLSETPVYHAKMGYAGTPDVEGDWQNTTWTLDIKSGVVPWTVGAQLAAYREARIPRPRRRLCVQLTGNGYKLHEQKDPSDFALFTSALNIHRAMAKRKPANALEYA